MVSLIYNRNVKSARGDRGYFRHVYNSLPFEIVAKNHLLYLQMILI